MRNISQPEERYCEHEGSSGFAYDDADALLLLNCVHEDSIAAEQSCGRHFIFKLSLLSLTVAPSSVLFSYIIVGLCTETVGGQKVSICNRLDSFSCFISHKAELIPLKKSYFKVSPGRNF